MRVVADASSLQGYLKRGGTFFAPEFVQIPTAQSLLRAGGLQQPESFVGCLFSGREVVV